MLANAVSHTVADGATIAKKNGHSGTQIRACLQLANEAGAANSLSKLRLSRKEERVQAGKSFLGNEQSFEQASVPKPTSIARNYKELFGLGYQQAPQHQTRSMLVSHRKKLDMELLQHGMENYRTLQANAPTKVEQQIPCASTLTRSLLLERRKAQFEAESLRFEPKKQPGIHKTAPPSYVQTFQKNKDEDSRWFEKASDYKSHDTIPNHEKLDHSPKQARIPKSAKKHRLPMDITKTNPYEEESYIGHATYQTKNWTNAVIAYQNCKGICNEDAYKYAKNLDEPLYSGFSPDQIFHPEKLNVKPARKPAKQPKTNISLGSKQKKSAEPPSSLTCRQREISTRYPQEYKSFKLDYSKKAISAAVRHAQALHSARQARLAM